MLLQFMYPLILVIFVILVRACDYLNAVLGPMIPIYFQLHHLIVSKAASISSSLCKSVIAFR